MLPRVSNIFHGRRTRHDSSSPHEHQPRRASSRIFQSSLIPNAPVNGDYLQRHMEMASRVLVMRCFAVSLLSAVLVGLLIAILWMNYSDLGVCVQEPPYRRGMGILTSWDHNLRIGSNAHYRCVQHQLAPLVLSMQCSSRRKWELLTLYNESCVCADPLPVTAFPSYHNSSDQRVGARIAYHCDPYRKTDPYLVAHCTFSKTWDVTRLNSSCWDAPVFAASLSHSPLNFYKYANALRLKVSRRHNWSRKN